MLEDYLNSYLNNTPKTTKLPSEATEIKSFGIIGSSGTNGLTEEYILRLTSYTSPKYNLYLCLDERLSYCLSLYMKDAKVFNSVGVLMSDFWVALKRNVIRPEHNYTPQILKKKVSTVITETFEPI